MNKKLLALSTLGLLLAACGPGGILGPTGTLEGQVIAPGGYSVLNTPTTAYKPTWDAPRRQGQLLVTRSSNFSAQSLSALSSLRTQSVDKDLTLVFTPVGQSDEVLAQTLEGQGFKVQPNYLYQSLGNNNPNDANFLDGSQYYLKTIRVPDAWAALDESKYNPLPTTVKIAVLDNGFQIDHPDLTNRFIKSAAKDFCPSLGDANNPACSGEDNTVTTDANVPIGTDIGHGTASSGIIGAQSNNSIGIAGITWSGQNILPIKVFGLTTDGRYYSGDTISIRRGINYAVAQGVRVINLSLGVQLYKAGTSDPAPGVESVENFDPLVRNELTAAYDKNIVVVAAAGNTNNEGIYYPASEGTVLAVGGVNKNNVLFSTADVPNSAKNTGSARPAASQTKNIDLVAPAIDILSTTDGGGYSSRPGTSEASPQVAGVAALLIAEKPNATAREINLALKGGAKNISSDERNYGAGLLDAKGALDKIRAGSAQPGQGGTGNQLNNFQYPVTVQAIRNNAVQATLNSILRSGESRVSYRFDNLPQGNYTLKATISKQQVATGTRTVNLSSSRVNIDICTDETGKNSCP